MSTYTKLILSGSTDGRAIQVAATATLGDTIHTAHATDLDELWLWAINTETTDRKLTIEFGGVLSPADHIEKTIVAEDGPQLIVPGLILTGSLVATAFAAVTNTLLIAGYINRITP